MSDPLYLGIEIGGTKLQLGLGRGDGRILALGRMSVVPEAGAERIRGQIAGAVDPLLTRLGMTRRDLRAVGVGFGGPVDAERGIVTVSNQIGGWAGFPLAAWLRESIGVSAVSVHNDADTAALGEARFGAGVGMSPLLYVNVGSGIGGGLILDGKIYRGAGRGAMEIGHLRMDTPDPDGDFGIEPETLEQVASGWSLAARARSWAEREAHDGWETGHLYHFAGGDPTRITAETVALAARANSYTMATVFLRDATLAIARGLAHAVTLLAPRRIVLGGGVSLMDEDLWIDPIRAELARRVFPPFRETYDLVPAALGEEVVVHGALALARDVATSG